MAIPEDQIKGNIRYVKIEKEEDEYYGFEAEGSGGSSGSSGGSLTVSLIDTGWTRVDELGVYTQTCEAMNSKGSKLTADDVCIVGIEGSQQISEAVISDWSKVYYAYTDCSQVSRKVVFYATEPTTTDSITVLVKW